MQKSVLSYLEDSVLKYPNKEVYFNEKDTVTYKELQNKSKQIASYLISLNITKKPLVIFLPKSIEALASFHGVTYSNNFYVPVDVTQPINRINNIFKVLEPAYVITNSRYMKNVEEIFPKEKILLYQDIENTSINEEELSKVRHKQISTDPVYVLFTSGSTGIPKGVCVSHQSIIDYTDWVQETFHFTSDDVLASQAPLFFDNSVLDIYSVLKNGASLFLTPDKYFGFPSGMMDVLAKYKVTTVFWVPSALIILGNSGILEEKHNPYFKRIMFCGEVMPSKHLNLWKKHYPNALFANLYGPTEITVDCLYYIVDREFDDDEIIPIGNICDNSDVFILNDNNQLITKPNELGEVYVRGISLSHGYYNDRERTDEAFVQNPLHNHYREMVYKTGDLAYYNERGEIIYSCRKDFQIKLNGYRIELGEIEVAVSSLDYIDQACVIFDNEIILVYTAKEELEEEKIKRDLIKLVPKYEIPSIIVKIDKMFRTASGKIDRNATKRYVRGEQ